VRRIYGIAIGLLLTAAACAGGQGLSADDIGTLVPAAARDQGTFRMSMTAVTTSSQQTEGQATEFKVSAEGGMDLRNERGLMTMSFEFPEGFGGGIGDASCEMRFEGDSGYLSVPEAQRAATGGKAWAKGLVSGVGFSGTVSAASPDAFLDLIGGIESLEQDGSEDVRGVATTRYTGTLSRDAFIEQALANVPEESRDQARQAFESFAPEGFPVELWVDDENLVRRIRMEMELGGGESIGATSVSTVEFFDYGEPVEVEIPDPADTQDVGDLQQAMGFCFGLPQAGGAAPTPE
jgi:hypothetical protein